MKSEKFATAVMMMQKGCKEFGHRRIIKALSLTLFFTLHSSLFIFFSSCEGENNISRDYRCLFAFDTSLHPIPCQLTGILGNPGHFCKVEASMVNGVRHLKTTRNYDGATEDITISTERERQANIILGANNSIIIGTVSYDNRLVAYDGQCPNCLKDYSGTSYPLAWKNNGLQLHCAKCDRAYDVNNGVIASGKGGIQLLTYYARLDGAVLRAWN